MIRRAFIGGTAAALSFPAIPVSAQTRNDSLHIAGAPTEEGAQLYYAREKGFFKAAGIDASVTFFPNGGATSQAIVAGAVDLGITNTGSMSSAHARGVPLTLLACAALFTSASPDAHLAVLKSSSIKTIKDLAGKTLAISTLRDLVQGSVVQMLENAGVDPKAVNFAEVPPPQMAETVLAKRVDGAVMLEPYFSSAKADLRDVAQPFRSVSNDKPFQITGYVTTRDWFGKNAALAKRFADSLHQTAKWANNPANRAECLTLLTQMTKIESNVLASYPRLAFAEVNKAEYVQPVVDLLAKYSYLPQSFSAIDIFAQDL